MKFDFYKGHALGNDYIVIDPARVKFKPSRANIKLLCSRSEGIGSDGVLWGPVKTGGVFSARIFNPDGGEAKKAATARASSPNTCLKPAIPVPAASPSALWAALSPWSWTRTPPLSARIWGSILSWAAISRLRVSKARRLKEQ
jgi:hypothetical protein